VAVVVKVADDRNRYAPLAQPFYDVRNRCGSLAGIHSDADKFGACARELLALDRGASTSTVSVLVIDWTTIDCRAHL